MATGLRAEGFEIPGPTIILQNLTHTTSALQCCDGHGEVLRGSCRSRLLGCSAGMRSAAGASMLLDREADWVAEHFPCRKSILPRMVGRRHRRPDACRRHRHLYSGYTYWTQCIEHRTNDSGWGCDGSRLTAALRAQGIVGAWLGRMVLERVESRPVRLSGFGRLSVSSGCFPDASRGVPTVIEEPCA
jgi:hypothetical protein